jgi:hypothetical protein
MLVRSENSGFTPPTSRVPRRSRVEGAPINSEFVPELEFESSVLSENGVNPRQAAPTMGSYPHSQ